MSGQQTDRSRDTKPARAPLQDLPVRDLAICLAAVPSLESRCWRVLVRSVDIRLQSAPLDRAERAKAGPALGRLHHGIPTSSRDPLAAVLFRELPSTEFPSTKGDGRQPLGC